MSLHYFPKINTVKTLIPSLFRFYSKPEQITLYINDNKNPTETPKKLTIKKGNNLMKELKEKDVDIEAACEGSCACSTCHIILDPYSFEKLNPASDKENDYLDKAWGVRPCSRLSCQVKVGDELEGAVVEIPKYTTNQDINK